MRPARIAPVAAALALVAACSGGTLSKADVNRCNDGLGAMRAVLTLIPRGGTSPDKATTVALASRLETLEQLSTRAESKDLRTVLHSLSLDVSQLTAPAGTLPAIRAMNRDAAQLDKVCHVH